MMIKGKMMATLSLIILMMGATSVFADSVQMTLTSGGHTVVINDNAANDSAPDLGAITFLGAVGGWNFNVSTGVQNGGQDYIDLNSIDDSLVGAAPLTILFSSEGNTLPSQLWNTAYAPTVNGGKAVFTAFYDNNNLYYGTAHVLSGPLTCNGGACAFNTTNLLTSTTPYSLTEQIVITPNGRGKVGYSGDVSLNPVPEPSSLLLLGAGLAGLALFGSRRKVTVN